MPKLSAIIEFCVKIGAVEQDALGAVHAGNENDGIELKGILCDYLSADAEKFAALIDAAEAALLAANR